MVCRLVHGTESGHWRDRLQLYRENLQAAARNKQAVLEQEGLVAAAAVKPKPPTTVHGTARLV